MADDPADDPDENWTETVDSSSEQEEGVWENGGWQSVRYKTWLRQREKSKTDGRSFKKRHMDAQTNISILSW